MIVDAVGGIFVVFAGDGAREGELHEGVLKKLVRGGRVGLRKALCQKSCCRQGEALRDSG